MKIDELKGKSVDELSELRLTLKKKALNLRFEKKSGALSNTAEIRTTRKTIARINTLLTSHNIKEAVGE